MSFYSEFILPKCLDWAMSDPQFSLYRQEVLAEVDGEILEIGFGTGLNLSHYPQHINKITTIDVNPGMNKQAKKRIKSCSIQVDNQVINSENLPMPDNTFDSVVSTWTLCSIAKVDQALKELYRVLKPGGKFFFIEHGLSEEPQIQLWQNRLNPLQKFLGDGCHLNRNIEKLVANNFQIISLEKFYTPKVPKTHGYMYQGVARKSTS